MALYVLYIKTGYNSRCILHANVYATRLANHFTATYHIDFSTFNVQVCLVPIALKFEASLNL